MTVGTAEQNQAIVDTFGDYMTEVPRPGLDALAAYMVPAMVGEKGQF